MTKSLFIIQGVVTDYRMPMYDALAMRLPEVKVAGGKDYFTPGIENAAAGRAWYVAANNHYFLGRRLLWQSGTLRPGWAAGAVLIELNPRILSGVLVVVLRAIAGRPTVVWGHVGKATRTWSIGGWFRRMLFKLSDGFVSYTHTDRVRMQAYGYLKPVWVTNNSCLHRQDCIFSPGSDRHELIYVGRLVKPKKVHVLVAAFARALPRLPSSIRLRVVGDGPERAALVAQVNAAGLSARVNFAGYHIDINELRPAYAAAFLAASPGYVGLSVIQAMGHGVPLLISRDEPHSPEIEACEEGENSFFFPTDDTAAAADLIVKAWQEREKWAAAGPSLAHKIAERYTYEAMTEAVSAALKWQIGEEAPPENK